MDCDRRWGVGQFAFHYHESPALGGGYATGKNELIGWRLILAVYILRREKANWALPVSIECILLFFLKITLNGSWAIVVSGDVRCTLSLNGISVYRIMTS
jgi:hypothetical protein